MTRASIILAVAWLAIDTAGAHAQSVQVTFKDGLVSVTAENATPRQILAEWARVGGTRIVNGDRVPGTPMTIQLQDVSERQALDVVLRTASGYMAAARTTGTGPSTLDRVHILATSNAPARTAAPPQTPTPFGRPLPQFPPSVDDTFSGPEKDPGDGRGVPPQPFPGAAGRNPNMPPQPFPPDDADDDGDEADVDEPAPARPTPSNPFGVNPGSNRPGVITPPPPAPPGTPGARRP